MRSIIYPLVISIGIVLLTFGIFHTMESSFSESLKLLEKNPNQFAMVSFFVLVSDIILPIPSTFVLYINGYFLGIISGTLVSISGLMIGAILGYYIGKAGSQKFQPEDKEKADQILSRYGPSAIFLTRGIPILSESICFVCGYHKIDFKRYLFLNFVGYLPICVLHAIFGSMGYEGGGLFILSFASSIAVSLAFWFFGKHILPKNELI